MTQWAVELMATVIAACVSWTDSLFSVVGGQGFVVAALIIVFVTSLLLMPLRGGGYVALGGAIGDFASSEMYKGKYWNGKRTVSKPGYKGKYLSSNPTSRTVRRGAHSRYYAGGSGKRGL